MTDMNWGSAVCMFIVAEILSHLIVFPVIKKLFYPNAELAMSQQVPKLGFSDVVKGVFERLVLILALVKGLPQVLVLFGAMKLGTRLTTGTESEAWNDYFLIGNLYSVALSIVYATILFPLNIDLWLIVQNIWAAIAFI